MTSDHQNNDIDWVNHNIVENHVSGNHLPIQSHLHSTLLCMYVNTPVQMGMLLPGRSLIGLATLFLYPESIVRSSPKLCEGQRLYRIRSQSSMAQVEEQVPVPVPDEAIAQVLQHNDAVPVQQPAQPAPEVSFLA